MNWLLYIIIGTIVVGCALLLIWGRPKDVPLDWEGRERLGVYRGEDMHLRVTQDIDLPLGHQDEVKELDGDADVARFWGTHPSGWGK